MPESSDLVIFVPMTDRWRKLITWSLAHIHTQGNYTQVLVLTQCIVSVSTADKGKWHYTHPTSPRVCDHFTDSYTIKYACEKNMQIRQNGPLKKFMCYCISCLMMYSTVKVYTVQIYAISAWTAYCISSKSRHTSKCHCIFQPTHLNKCRPWHLVA